MKTEGIFKNRRKGGEQAERGKEMTEAKRNYKKVFTHADSRIVHGARVYGPGKEDE